MIVGWLSNVDWASTGAMIGGMSTLVVACLTYVLIKENKLLRRAGNSPVVVAHFETHPDGNGAVMLALSNVGTGPAFDVSYVFECDHADFSNYDLIFKHEKERPPLTMIGQGAKFSFIFAVGYRLFMPKDSGISHKLQPFYVRVNWRSLGSVKIQSARYLLDVAAYEGIPGITSKPALVKISDDLAAINRHLAKMASHAVSQSGYIDVTDIEKGARVVVKGGDTSSE